MVLLQGIVKKINRCLSINEKNTVLSLGIMESVHARATALIM